MRARAAQLAGCLILALSAASGCRRPPPAAKAPDGGTDALAGRADASATNDGRLDAPDDAAPDAGNAADSGIGDVSATDAVADAATDLSPPDGPRDLRLDVVSGDAPSDTAAGDAPSDAAPGDIPPDVPIDIALGDAFGDGGDAPVDSPSTDGSMSDGSDVRPEDQPCGSAGISCRPYACDLTRGICKAVCLIDDDCASGVHCNTTNRCGLREDTPCTSDSECLTGHCAQGVCCLTACNQRCYSCASPGAIHTCMPVPAGNLDPIGTCANGTYCDGRGECIPPSCTADAACGPLHLCTNARCVPCSPTCASTPDCDVGAICINRNGCTYCDIADASAGQ